MVSLVSSSHIYISLIPDNSNSSVLDRLTEIWCKGLTLGANANSIAKFTTTGRCDPGNGYFMSFSLKSTRC